MLGILGVTIQKTLLLIWIKKRCLLGSYSIAKAILYFCVKRDDSDTRVERFAPDPGSTQSGPYYQERGASHAIRDGLSPTDHAENDRSLGFPPSKSAALPKDVVDAVDFISAEHQDSMRSSWRDALSHLRSRADQLREERGRFSDGDTFLSPLCF